MQAILEDIEQGRSKLSALVPPDTFYFDRLIGAGSGETTIEDYAETTLRPLIRSLIDWDPNEGAKLALLLAGHACILMAVDEATLSKVDLLALASWARDEGDPLAQLAMVELGASHLARDERLAPVLAEIATQLLVEDAENDQGRIKLLSSVFMLVEGELSRARTSRPRNPSAAPGVAGPGLTDLQAGRAKGKYGPLRGMGAA